MKFTREQLSEAVANSVSMRGVLRYLGIKLTGGSQSHWKARIKTLGIDTSHFTGQAHARGHMSSRKLSADEILILREDGGRADSKKLVRALLESGIEHKCDSCGQLPAWLGFPLTLDVDHINENWLDDRLENLRFLCPNCHSQFSRNLRK